MSHGHSLMAWNQLTTSKADTAGGKFSTSRQITLEELRSNPQWSAFRGLVYDLTAYAPYHPGGVDELMRAGGADGTLLFDEFHPWINVASMLRKCQVGVLAATTTTVGTECWQEVEMVSCKQLDGDNSPYYIVRLASSSNNNTSPSQTDEEAVLSHCRLATSTRANKNIERLYTQLLPPFAPATSDDGVVSLLVKRSAKKSAKTMTHELCTCAIGTKFKLMMEPSWIVGGRRRDDADCWFTGAREIGMVVCGSGITPALQIISRVLSSAATTEKKKKLYLVWCHRSRADGALAEELAAAQAKLEGRLVITHLLSRQEEHEQASSDCGEVGGRFDSEFMDAHGAVALPKPAAAEDESVVLICGTWEFERSARGTLFLAGFSSQALLRIGG